MARKPGRPTWTIPVQEEFLQAHVANLDEEKSNQGLKPFYACITQEFMTCWPSLNPPGVDETDLVKLKKLADEARGRISQPLYLQTSTDCHPHQQITEWFKKTRCKPGGAPPPPKSSFDLTGKHARKPSPLQPHQAYSVRYFRPENSPLRMEVNNLWARRQEQEVVNMLTPFFIKEKDCDTRMLFHNAVMCWKCSELSEDEKQDLQTWIDDKVEQCWDVIQHPWRNPNAMEVEELTAENQYIQKYVPVSVPYCDTSTDNTSSNINALPSTLQAALDEVERVTGLKALLLLGGPIPTNDGNILTHL